MTQPDGQPTPNQDPIQFSGDQFKLTMDLSEAILHQPSPILVNDHAADALKYVRATAELAGQDPVAGEAAILGAAIGTLNNDPSRFNTGAQLDMGAFDELRNTSLDEEHLTAYSSMISNFRMAPGRIDVVSGFVSNAMSYASAHEREGKDMTAFKTLALATGLNASKDPAWRGQMASDLSRQISQS